MGVCGGIAEFFRISSFAVRFILFYYQQIYSFISYWLIRCMRALLHYINYYQSEKVRWMERIYGLAPVVGNDPRVLILGSMPSEQSLQKQEYYGNKRNHFWTIMLELFNSHERSDYEEKISFLKKHKIALWDVLHSCHREGSLDVNIKNEEPNEIEAFVKEYPTIRLIVCNGSKAFKSYQKYIGINRFPGVEVIKLPSTSPVPGKYNKTLEGKIQEWKVIKKYLSDT